MIFDKIECLRVAPNSPQIIFLKHQKTSVKQSEMHQSGPKWSSCKLKTVEIPLDQNKKSIFWILTKSPARRADSQPNLRSSPRSAQDCRESNSEFWPNHQPGGQTASPICAARPGARRTAGRALLSRIRCRQILFSAAKQPKQRETSEVHFFAWSNGFSMILLAHVVLTPTNLNTFRLFSLRFFKYLRFSYILPLLLWRISALTPTRFRWFPLVSADFRWFPTGRTQGRILYILPLALWRVSASDQLCGECYKTNDISTILAGPLTGKDMWPQICHGAYFLKNRFYCIGVMKYWHFPTCRWFQSAHEFSNVRKTHSTWFEKSMKNLV